MTTIANAVMYLKYLEKVAHLKLLKLCKGLDFCGRIENQNKDIHGYEGCYPVGSILDRLKITSDDAILDIGCGKGLFLYYASKYPFYKIDGIDYSAELVRIAKCNLNVLGDDRMHVRHVDAREFADYGDYNYFFINNPFGPNITQSIVDLLSNCFVENKKRLTVIYQFPFNLNMFQDKGFAVIYDCFPNVVLTLG